MNPRIIRLLLRLYPRAWRSRYADEFTALLESTPATPRTLINTLAAAFRERVAPTRSGPAPHSLQRWSIRAPWLIFGLAPLLLLAAAYVAACFYLWLGWQIFLPAANTPFGHASASLLSAQNLYFQLGKLFYFSAPVLVGWAIGLIAAKQRSKSLWLLAGLISIAWLGSTVQIHASRTAVSSALGHIHISLPHLLSLSNIYATLPHTLAILALAAFPYFILRGHAAAAASQQ